MSQMNSWFGRRSIRVDRGTPNARFVARPYAPVRPFPNRWTGAGERESIRLPGLPLANSLKAQAELRQSVNDALPKAFHWEPS